MENTQKVKPALGLVCITHGDEVRYKTTTRKQLFKFDEATQREKLRELYAENLSRLGKAIEYCAANDIRLYRMTSGLFPFSDESFGLEILGEFKSELAATGQHAIRKGIRLVLHPDQFCVLNSDSDEVIKNSIKILTMHATIMDLLEQPRSEWALMNIHGGKSDRIDKLVETIGNLPEAIKSRVTFENDEHAYSSTQILEVCRRAGVPFVFDAHHHICREGLDSYEDPSVIEMFWAARETWKNPEWQLVHISNGRDRFADRVHADVVWDMPSVFKHAGWIEVEAKTKEFAIKKLQDEWLSQLDLLADDQTIIGSLEAVEQSAIA